MSAAPRDGFRRLLLAEWTKVRTVVGTAGCLLAVAASLVAVAMLISSGRPGTYGDEDYVDEFRFVHRTLTGDGTLTARVRTQEAGHPWAMAGIMIKQAASPGSPHAALLVTREHGVRFQANFRTDVAGSASAAPRHLRLTRAGDTVTGQESADGRTWTTVGSATLRDLPATVETGMFVTSPGLTRVHPMRMAAVQLRPSTATFDAVRLTATTPSGRTTWRGDDVGRPGERVVATAPDGPDARGVFTLTGSGDIIRETDDGSRVVAATAGTVFAAMPAVALGALVMTSEFRWRTGLATFAASPRRGRVLAAKAVVVATATFATGLVATLGALLITQPLLRRNGFRPPVYADPSLSDPLVLRVALGTAAFLALLALTGLGVAAVLRRSGAAITVVSSAILVPLLVVPFLPSSTGSWLQRVTPLAGMSVQQIRETEDALLLPWVGRPWLGLAITGAYAVAALALGFAWLRRTDA